MNKILQQILWLDISADTVVGGAIMSRDFSGGQKKRMQQPTGEILVGLENALFVISFSLIQPLPGVDPVTGQSTVGKALLKSKGLFRICVGHCLRFLISSTFFSCWHSFKPFWYV